MRQELHIWRSEAGSRRWLSALIAAMDAAQYPELHRQAVAPETLARFRAQLALPAAYRLAPTSGLRH